LKLSGPFQAGANVWYLAPDGSYLIVLIVRGGVVEQVGIADWALASSGDAELAFMQALQAIYRQSVHVSGPLVYNGHAFSIDYPAGWKLKNREKRQSWGGTDTTIAFPDHPNALIRIDVRPHGGPKTPAAAASQVIKSTSQEPGYRRLELSSGTLDGYPAIRWQFLVTESGAVMREEDDFIVDPKNGANVAVLTEAPVDEYPSLAAEFAAVRRSLTIK
jgi:hypothetical protein